MAVLAVRFGLGVSNMELMFTRNKRFNPELLCQFMVEACVQSPLRRVSIGVQN